jgi:hypothetical protein
MKPPISSADLLQAFYELKPRSDPQKHEIAQVLGLEWMPAIVPMKAAPSKEETRVPEPKQKTEPSQVRPVRPVDPLPIVPTVSDGFGFTISGPRKLDAPSALWAAPTGEFETPPTVPPPEVAPLFVPRWTRGIMSTALAMRSPTGEPDIRKVVHEIARGRVLRKLPRLYTAAMASRVEVLVDAGDSMLPFAQDQRGAIKSIRMVAGYDNVEVLKFTGSPLRGAGTDEEDVWAEYSFPPPDTHVLMLTDLGVGRPPFTDTQASVDEWLRFARELRRRGIACTVFVPYPAKRWPLALARHFRLVEWDRATTASSVRFSRKPKRT